MLIFSPPGEYVESAMKMAIDAMMAVSAMASVLV
jgi:hypothetical protein